MHVWNGFWRKVHYSEVFGVRKNVEIGDFCGEWMVRRIEIKEMSVQRSPEVSGAEDPEKDRRVTIFLLSPLVA